MPSCLEMAATGTNLISLEFRETKLHHVLGTNQKTSLLVYCLSYLQPVYASIFHRIPFIPYTSYFLVINSMGASLTAFTLN